MSWNFDNAFVMEQNQKCSFTDYTLILPDISIGNVGQLTVDLLLNNLETDHLGCIVHPCFYPFIGGDPFQFESTKLTSSCEIYECKRKKLIILQIRSRIFPGKLQEFKTLLVQFIKRFNFKQTVVSTSSSSEYFAAEQLDGVPVHYLNSSIFAKKDDLMQLKWKEFSFPDNMDNSIVAPVPGSFVSQVLLESSEKENISLLVVICVCSEGDNYPEALQVANCLNSWLSLKQEKKCGEIWKMPVSWMLPYGSAAPHTIY